MLLVIVALIIPLSTPTRSSAGRPDTSSSITRTCSTYFSIFFALPHERDRPRGSDSPTSSSSRSSSRLPPASGFGPAGRGWRWSPRSARPSRSHGRTDVAGLPALPALSLGFLLPNVDLIWAQLRRRGRGLCPAPARG